MHLPHAKTSTLRLTWSAVLLVLLGLCSLGSPHLMKTAAVHHRQVPTSGSTRRDSRQNGRSTRGGICTELDRHGAESDRASQGVRPQDLGTVPVVMVAGLPVPRFVLAVSMARSAIGVEDDAPALASYSSLASRGRAPPSI